jgi:hypothetical protein
MNTDVNQSWNADLLTTKQNQKFHNRPRARSDFGLALPSSSHHYNLMQQGDQLHATLNQSEENNEITMRRDEFDSSHIKQPNAEAAGVIDMNNNNEKNSIKNKNNLKENEARETLISPTIFNTNLVVSTSTPSNKQKDQEETEYNEEETGDGHKTITLTHNDRSILSKKNSNPNILHIDTSSMQSSSHQSESIRITKNQSVIKIINGNDSSEITRQKEFKRQKSSSVYSTNETKISAIEELDKCIAMYDDAADSTSSVSTSSSSSSSSPERKALYMSSVYTTAASSSSSSSTSSLQKAVEIPRQSSLINQNSKPEFSKCLKTYKSDLKMIDQSSFVSNTDLDISHDSLTQITSMLAPPPPPPLPTSWFSLKEKSLQQQQPQNRHFILTPQNNNNKAESAMRQQQAQQNSAGKHKIDSIHFIDELQAQIKSGTLLRKNKKNYNNNNYDVQVLNNGKTQIYVRPNENYLIKNENKLRGILSVMSENNINQFSSVCDMPEWKRLLIERKKEKQSMMREIID